jgi:hypothetical protein
MKRLQFIASLLGLPFGYKLIKERQWGEPLIFDKNQLNFGNILDVPDLFPHSDFKLSVRINHDLPRLGDGERTYAMSADGNGKSKLYINGKWIRTIPTPKDCVYKFSDFGLWKNR